MAHGLEVFTVTGAARLRVTDRLTRLLHARFIAAGEASNVTVSGFSTSTGVAVLAPRYTGVPELSATKVMPQLTIAGDNIAWSYAWWTGSAGLRIDCDLLVFAYR